MELNTTLNKHYAVGFQWKMITSSADIFQQAYTLAQSLDSPCICIVRRKKQIGFASGSKEWIGLPSLASAFAAGGGTHLWISHIDTNTWWVCAIKDGIIVHGGDHLTDTADASIEHALHLQEIFALPDVEFCADTKQLDAVLHKRTKGRKFLLYFSNRVKTLNPIAINFNPTMRFNKILQSRTVFGSAILALLMVTVAYSTNVTSDSTYLTTIQKITDYLDVSGNPTGKDGEFLSPTLNYMPASNLFASTVLGRASASENAAMLAKPVISSKSSALLKSGVSSNTNISSKSSIMLNTGISADSNALSSSTDEFKMPSLLSNSWYQANGLINTRVVEKLHDAKLEKSQDAKLEKSQDVKIEASQETANNLLDQVTLIKTAQATALENNSSLVASKSNSNETLSAKGSLKNTPYSGDSSKGAEALQVNTINLNKSAISSKGNIKKESVQPLLIASSDERNAIADTKQKDNTPSRDSFIPGTLGYMLKLRAELEHINMQVEVEEARTRLNKLLYVEEEPVAVPVVEIARPSLNFPPIGMPDSQKTSVKTLSNTRIKPFRILSIQSIKGKYTAIVDTNSGTRRVKVNDVILGRRVVSISRNTVVMNRGQGNETLTIQD